MAMASPPTAPQAPSASPRRCGETAADSRVSVSGMRMAAPTGGERSGGRAGGEQAEADHEQPAATVPLAQCRAGEQKDGERQRVRVDRPLQALKPGVQVLADRRQRRGDHEVVQ